MKVYPVIGLVVFIFLLTGLTPATAYTIDDPTNGPNTYWGGLRQAKYPSNQDVIGGEVYAVNGIDVKIIANTMTVQVIGPFFSLNDVQLSSGDLYLSSTGWHVSTSDSPHFPTDVFGSFVNGTLTNTEGWDYVVGNVLCRLSGCTAEVYKLKFDSITWTNSSALNNDGRAYQAYRGGYGEYIEDATVAFDTSGGDNSSMTFTFDKTFLGNPLNVGIHWAEYCGNDVVEGEYNKVPEPGTLLLLGGGLIAIGAFRRRFGK